jgi:signal transduction histidine kinase
VCALSSSVRHHLYLVVREAINNIVRHAAASEVWLRVAVEPEFLSLVITDNGQGFDAGSVNLAASATPGARVHDGLENMAHRIKTVGGQFEILSRPGQGTIIRLTVPLKPESSPE